MDRHTPSFNLNVVVRETGIKPDTLRAWERRYGLPDPHRTDGGHRLYSSHDIEMIRWLMARQDEGMRISQAVRMWKGLEADGTNPLTPEKKVTILPQIPADLPDNSILVQLRQSWVESSLAFNEIQADQVFSQALARFPIQIAAVEVLQKGLSLIGSQWFQTEVTVQQEHFASAMAIKRLDALIAAAPAPTRSERIIIGCPPGEEHTFSPLLINLFLRYHGYDITYLGANVPLTNLDTTIDELKPDLVIFTAMQLDAAAGLMQVAQRLADHKVVLGFGGRIFSTQPSLQGIIPGIFLGERLDRVVEYVAQALDGGIQPNPPFALDGDYKAALEAYDRNRLALELNIYRSYVDSEFPVEFLEVINHHFNQYVRAALVLGNLDYLDAEISWSEALIANNRIPAELVKDYLKVYHQNLQDLGDDRLALVAEWLSDRLSVS